MGADVANRLSSDRASDYASQHHAPEKHRRLSLVVNNTLISLAGQIVTWMTTLTLTMTYGRFLGPVGLGELYLAATLTGLIGFPLEFGFNQQIIREVASAPERTRSYVANALLLKVLLWTPLCLALMGVAALLRYSTEVRIIVALSGLTLLATSIGAAFGSMQIAIHRNVIPVIGSIIEKGFDALAAYLALRILHVGIIPVACVLLLGATLNTSWQAYHYYRHERFSLKLDRVMIREIVHTSVPFLLYGALGVIYYRIDTVLLGAIDGDAVVGLYGAGYKIFDTLIFLPSLVMSTVMYPLMARLSANEPRAYRIAIDKSMNFLLICGMPLATGLGVAAPAIVGFLYHNEAFSRTILVMEALAPGLIFLYINSVISNIIITRHRERSLVWMAAVALVLNLGLNLALIPRYHEAAAAAVTSITEFALLIMGLFAIPRELIPLGSLPTLLKASLACATMALVILALGQFSILVIIPAAAATYGLAGFVLGLVPREDARALLDAVRRKAERGARATDVVDSLAPDGILAAESAPQLALQIASSATRATTSRRATRSTPLLASYYAVSKPSQRARLVTRAAPSGPLAQRARASQGPARQSKRHAVMSQPLRGRLAPATVRLAGHLG